VKGYWLTAIDIEYQPCNTGQAGEPSNVARFQEFSRLELPRLVRRTLEVAVEEEAQPLEDKLKERLVDIVRECQSQLITMFQTTQTPSNVGTANVALIPALESGSRIASDPVPQTNLPTADIPFRGFESIAGMDPEFMTMPALSEVTEQLKFEQNAEGSPDSGYDSTWPGTGARINPTNASHTFHQEPSVPQSAHPFNQATMFEQQPSYMSATAFMTSEYTENEYTELGGYYGLFENRGGEVDLRTLNPSWAYTTAGSGNAMGSSGMM